MKAKIKRGNGFRGLLNYVFGPGEHQKSDRAHLIGGNMSGTDPRLLSAEFKISRQLRQKAKNPAWHCSLSMPAGEKQISDEKWQKIVSAFLKKMKISDDHQYCVVSHDDTDHDHLHIILSRISLNGNLWSGANDVKKAIKATQQLEKDFNLTITAGFDKKNDVKKLTSAEIQKSARTRQAPARAVLQKIVAKALADKPTIEVFLERLQIANIKVRPNIAKTGRVFGLAFHYNNVSFKGSQLGKKFGWKELLRQGLQYDLHRDAELLGECQKNADFSVGKISCADANKFVYESTLILAFRNDGNGRYFWKNRAFVAFKDNGNSISFNTINKTAIRAGIQLAKSKNWGTLKITSDDKDFAIVSYIEARKYFDADKIQIESEFYLSNEIEEIEKKIMINKEARNGKNASSKTTRRTGNGRNKHEYRNDDVMPRQNKNIIRNSIRGSEVHRNRSRRHSKKYDENQKDLQIINGENHSHGNCISINDGNGGGDSDMASFKNSLYHNGGDQKMGTDRRSEGSKHVAAKIAAWEQQSAELDEPVCRITLTNAAGNRFSDFSEIQDAPLASPAERKEILDEMVKYFSKNRKLIMDGEVRQGTRDPEDPDQENNGGMRM